MQIAYRYFSIWIIQVKLLKEWSNHASGNYVKVLIEKLMLSLSYTTKISFFTNAKDKTPSLSQSFVVCTFTCPGCSCSYIGRMERTLHERTEEHGYHNKKSNEQSAIYKHLFHVNNHDVNCNKFDMNQVRSNTIVLDKADN